jgi:hypothetical protein
MLLDQDCVLSTLQGANARFSLYSRRSELWRSGDFGESVGQVSFYYKEIDGCRTREGVSKT